MAEEEVLTEMAPPPKKKEGGGFSFVHLIIIAVVTAIVVAIGFFMVGREFTASASNMEKKIDVLTRYKSGDDAFRDHTLIKDCDAEGGITVPLKDGPLIVNLADGEHYLSVGISVCISDKITPEKFALKKDFILHVCNEFLSMLSYDDLFPGKGGDDEKIEQSAEESELSALDFEEKAPNFSVKKDQVRGGLLKAFAERNVRVITEVYFTEFLVQ